MRLAEEGEEFAVNDFGVGPSDRVWPECDLHYPASLHKLRDAACRGGDGENAIGNAMNDESGYIESSEILAKVFEPRCYAIECALGRSAGGVVPTELNHLLAD